MRLFYLTCILALLVPLFCEPIHDFTEEGNLTKIDSILTESPEKFDLPDSDGDTPLRIAAWKGNTELVKYFIDKGADVNAPRNDGGLAIHIAAYDGHTEVVKLLVENGALIDEFNGSGFTSLQLAIFKDRIDIVDFLLEKGANISIHDTRYGGTALHWAANRGNRELINRFIELGIDKDLHDSRGNSPIHWAASANQIEGIKALVELGANVNSPSQSGDLLITNCVFRRNVDATKYLLDHGTDLNIVDNDGKTVVLNALEAGNVEIVRLLMDHGAKIEEPVCSTETQNCNNNVNTPIHMATWSGVDMLELVFEHYTDVNKKNGDGEVPLMMTAWRDSTDEAKFLIDHGADVNIVDNNGKSTLYKAVERGNIDLIKLLIENGADVNVQDSKFKQASLHIAAANGFSDVAEILIESGAKINKKDGYKRTPLYLAEYYGNTDVADLIKSNKGKTKPKFKDELLSINDINLADDEALIVYQYHAGFAIITEKSALLIDNWQDGKVPDNPNIMNGWVTPEELEGKKVYIISSHEHGDHWCRELLTWGDKIENLTYVMGFHPEQQPAIRNEPMEIPAYNFVTVRMSENYNGLQLTTFPATDAGVGFLIELDGFTILHPGDHANADMEIDEAFKSEIDYLADLGKDIDFAFFPMTGCGFPEIEPVKEGIYYAANKLKIKNLFPMHVSNNTMLIAEFKEECQENIPDVKIHCIQHRGDRFLFKKQNSSIEAFTR